MKPLVVLCFIVLLITACSPSAPAPTATVYISSQMKESTVTASNITGATMDAANLGNPSGETVGSLLTVPQQNAIPQGQSNSVWGAATGSLKLSTGGNVTVASVNAQKLVPNALYSVWWIRPGEAEPQKFIPVAPVPTNTFKTDAQGNGTLQFNVPSNSEYFTYTLALIYHADNLPPTGQLNGLGSTIFLHLIGAGPGLSLPPGQATIMATDLAEPTLQTTLPVTLSATLEATAEAR